MTLLATFFWGSNFQAAKVALSSTPPWTASAERFIVAVIGTFALLVLKERIRLDVLMRNFFAFGLLGVIGVAGFNGALFIGLQTSSPVTAALIMATTPISANIIEVFAGRQLPTLGRIIGMAVSLLGVSLVITNGRILSGQIEFAAGDLIILAGSIGWAIYTVGIRTLVSGATPLETTAWTTLFGTIALGVAAFCFEFPAQALQAGTEVSFVAILWMGLAGSVLAYLFWNIGIAARGPGKTSVFFNLVPVFAVLIELALGTAPHPMQMVGIVITILGVVIAQRGIARFRGRCPVAD